MVRIVNFPVDIWLPTLISEFCHIRIIEPVHSGNLLGMFRVGALVKREELQAPALRPKRAPLQRPDSFLPLDDIKDDLLSSVGGIPGHS